MSGNPSLRLRLPVLLGFAFICASLRLAAESNAAATEPPKRVAVLSAKAEPGRDTSQGLYLQILREAGFEARAISAEEVRETKLKGFDIFVIGGGSGTAFNKSLGEDGGRVVREFVHGGGGALASCAGGYSFAHGHNEALRYISIARATIVDAQNGRWARGKGEVEIAPADGRFRPLTMFYANGPLWEVMPEQGEDRTVALALYRGDVKKGDDPGGVMPGTPAILGGTFGDGRFVLFSAHPEYHQKLGNRPLLVDAARWVTRGRLRPGETVRWEDVFPRAPKVAP